MTQRKQRNVSSSGQLSLAKISRPELLGVYQRGRLFRHLDRARKCPIVWLSAPAGSGKTTLVASYLQARRLHALWYQMEAGDNDAASFFYYMGLAAQASAPKQRQLPLLTHEYQAGLPVFTINYFRELFARLKRGSIVVLDDYQAVATDGNIQEILQLGLEQIPAGVSVIVISREAPPSSFARSVSRERIAQLEWQDLRLTEQETAGIINLRRKKSSFTQATISRLYQDTQGWVAGLILLVQKTEQELNEYSSLGSGKHRSIFHYFAGEIFRHSDSETQAFLLKTAIIPTISVAVSQSLTGVNDAKRIFDDLVQRNLFTFRRVDGSFEYHPLFRAFLIAHAAEFYTQAEIKGLKKSVAQLLVKSGELEAAIALLQEAEDWKAALQIVTGHAQSLIAQGRTQTVDAWLSNFPQDVRDNEPDILYWQGICNLTNAPAKAREHLKRAYDYYAQGDNGSALYLTWSAIIESHLLDMSDFAAMLAWLERYPELCRSGLPVTAGVKDSSLFTYLYALLATGGDRVDLRALARRASEILDNENNQGRYMRRALILVSYYLWIGDVVRVQGLLERLTPYVLAPSTPPYARLNWYMWMSLCCTMAGTVDASQRYAKEAVAIASASGIHAVDLQVLVFSIRGELCLGNTIAARVLLSRLAKTVNQGRVNGAYYSHHASLVSMHEGNLDRAIDEGKRAVESARATDLFIGTMTSLMGLAFAYAQRGNVEAALETIGEAKRKAEQFQSKCFISYCALCEAAVYRLTGNQPQLLRTLNEALSLAREGNFVTPAYCPRDTAAALYSLALEYDIESDYVRTIIAKTRLPPPSGSMPEYWPWRLRIYTLGRFALFKDSIALDVFGSSGAKAQKKPLELLRALATFGGRNVGLSKLAHALWPDTDGDKARTTLRSTLLRLRRLIGEEAVVQQGNYLSLNAKYCWLDVWAFDQLCNRRDEGVAPSVRANRLFALYGGSFLPDSEESWAINQRDRLGSMALRVIAECGGELEKRGRLEEAATLYQRGVETDPLAEELYRRLMFCYSARGRVAEALALYRRFSAKLSRTLQIEPAAETKLLYREIQKGAENHAK